jgi:hypothetical protein
VDVRGIFDKRAAWLIRRLKRISERLSIKYQSGTDLHFAKDEDEAIKCYQKAAEAGSSSACILISGIYKFVVLLELRQAVGIGQGGPDNQRDVDALLLAEVEFSSFRYVGYGRCAINKIQCGIFTCIRFPVEA